MNEVIMRSSVSLGGVFASWGLLDISLMLACLASFLTIVYTGMGIIKLSREMKK